MTRRDCRRHLRRLLTLAALLAAPIAAANAQVVKWGAPVAGWNISVDRPSSSCAMAQTFSGGTTLLVMFHRPSRQFSFGLSNSAWNQYITHGDSYSIRMVMDGARWKASFVGKASDGSAPYLFLPGLKTEFLVDFMKRNTIQFYNATNGAHITSLPLAGSTAAMTELVECQRAMNAATPTPTKPQAQTFTQ